jgi:hypothetical protein
MNNMNITGKWKEAKVIGTLWRLHLHRFLALVVISFIETRVLFASSHTSKACRLIVHSSPPRWKFRILLVMGWPWRKRRPSQGMARSFRVTDIEDVERRRRRWKRRREEYRQENGEKERWRDRERECREGGRVSMSRVLWETRDVCKLKGTERGGHPGGGRE